MAERGTKKEQQQRYSEWQLHSKLSLVHVMWRALAGSQTRLLIQRPLGSQKGRWGDRQHKLVAAVVAWECSQARKPSKKRQNVWGCEDDNVKEHLGYDKWEKEMLPSSKRKYDNRPESNGGRGSNKSWLREERRLGTDWGRKIIVKWGRNWEEESEKPA